MNKDQIASDCEAWGEHWHKHFRGWSSRSVLGRVIDEGWGASSGGCAGGFVPAEFIRSDLIYVDRAYRALTSSDPSLADFMVVCFAVRAGYRRKMEALKLTKNKYYDKRLEVISFVAAYRLTIPESDLRKWENDDSINVNLY